MTTFPLYYRHRGNCQALTGACRITVHSRAQNKYTITNPNDEQGGKTGRKQSVDTYHQPPYSRLPGPAADYEWGPVPQLEGASAQPVERTVLRSLGARTQAAALRRTAKLQGTLTCSMNPVYTPNLVQCALIFPFSLTCPITPWRSKSTFRTTGRIIRVYTFNPAMTFALCKINYLCILYYILHNKPLKKGKVL